MRQLEKQQSVSLRARENGSTLVEIMVAIFVLLVGVLGSVTLVDAANRTTSTTRARESATTPPRSVPEAARSLPSAALAQATAAPATRPDRGPADSAPATSGWQVKRRNIT